MTEGKVCADPTEYEKSEGRELYELIRTSEYYSCSTEIADSYYDPRYDEIGSVREDRLFEDNEVINVIKNLPNYPIQDSLKYHWNLYSNNYFEWKSECNSKDGVDRDSLLRKVDDFNNVHTVLAIALSFTVFLLILSCIFVVLSYIYKSDQYDGESLKSKKIYEIMSVSIKTMLVLIIIWYSYTNISIIQSYHTSIHALGESKCSDDFSNEAFIDFSTVLVES